MRKCVEKVTGKIFAVKIVDVSTEHQSLKDALKLREETKSEVELLRELRGHPAISEFRANPFPLSLSNAIIFQSICTTAMRRRISCSPSWKCKVQLGYAMSAPHY